MPKPKNAFQTAIKNHYLTRLSELLQEIYTDRSSPIGAPSEKHQRLAGFIEAALISRILTNADIQAVVDDEHERAYGLTVQERGLIQQQVRIACADHDFELFDAPTYTRRKPRRARQQKPASRYRSG